MKKLIVTIVVLLCGCGDEYLDHGFMEIDGVVLHPNPPYYVLNRSSLGGVLEDSIEHINEKFGEDLFILHGQYTPDIIVWNTYLDPSIGGLTEMDYNSEGEITRADISISPALDDDTTRGRILHELGHVLGLAHDEDSMDLGSCMSSPPQYECRFTDADVTRVREYLENDR